MNNIPRQKLREIILQYGRSLCDEPKRCEAFLQDFCGQYHKEVSVLIIALKERVPADLLASPNSIPPVVLLARLTKRLQENLSLTEDAARWAVESWGLALGVISEADIASIPLSSPTPRQENIIVQIPSSTPAIQADKNQLINNNVKTSRSNNLISPRPSAFLIPPSERIQFVRSFTLLTTIIIFIIQHLISGLRLAILIHLLFLGIAIGVTQWVFLRRYLPFPFSQQWIFATSIGWFIQGFEFIEQSDYPFLGLPLIVIFQWIVLKQYIKSAWWWIFIGAGALIIPVMVRVFGWYIALSLFGDKNLIRIRIN